MNQKSNRWHYQDGDRTFIIYAATMAEAHQRVVKHIGLAAALVTLKPSGYYCRKTNTIVGAMDGDTVIIDARKSGM